MTPTTEVDAWFDAYDNPMKPVVQRLREIVLEADPRIEETIKWQAPTFMYKGNLASFYPKSRQHASLMFRRPAGARGDREVLVRLARRVRVPRTPITRVARP